MSFEILTDCAAHFRALTTKSAGFYMTAVQPIAKIAEIFRLNSTIQGTVGFHFHVSRVRQSRVRDQSLETSYLR